MPHMNGKQLADEVRRRMPNLPILFVSGYTDDIIAQHGIVGGGIALLSKPFSPATLGQRVRELLDARV
jgi:CheY-like chemotaxis protein